jgi:integrase
VSLWKRGGVWWSYVYVDGVRHAKSTHTGNRRIAEKVDHDFKEELTLAHLGIKRPEPEMSFGELSARFLANGDVKAYHRDRLKVLLPFFHSIAIGRITKVLVRDYRSHRHSEKQVSETTVNRDVEALRHMLYWAVDEGLLITNPLSRISLVRERHKPRMVMTVGEEQRLLSAAAPHLRAIITFAVDTGMRRGEILTERWEHIDLDRKLLFVTHSKTAGGEGREIPLTERVFTYLTRAAQPQGHVFSFKGEPLRNIKTAWKAAIRRAGIRYYRFHDLRHTFNTRLMEAGVIQDIRKTIMGHSSGEDVHSIYTHVELPAKREAIRKLEQWVSQQLEQLELQGDLHERAKNFRNDSENVIVEH